MLVTRWESDVRGEKTKGSILQNTKIKEIMEYMFFYVDLKLDNGDHVVMTIWEGN